MNNSKHTHTRKLLAAAWLAGVVLGGPALAKPSRDYQRQDNYSDYAQVVSSTPVYEQVNTPRRECWTEQVGYESSASRSYVGALLGGVTGAILGNQVGKGTGRTVAVAVGAATGAIVGDNIDNDGHVASYAQPRYEERCRTVDNWDRRLSGYNVTYRYQGREYTTFLPYDPGQRVRVNVNVSLAD